MQTLLRGLEEKGSISHEAEGRTFVFVPLVAEEKFKRNATRDLVQRVFGGKAGSLVAHLLKNENVSREEIEEIRKLINVAARNRESHAMNWLHTLVALLGRRPLSLNSPPTGSCNRRC